MLDLFYIPLVIFLHRLYFPRSNMCILLNPQKIFPYIVNLSHFLFVRIPKMCPDCFCLFLKMKTFTCPASKRLPVFAPCAQALRSGSGCGAGEISGAATGDFGPEGGEKALFPGKDLIILPKKGGRMGIFTSRILPEPSSPPQARKRGTKNRTFSEFAQRAGSASPRCTHAARAAPWWRPHRAASRPAG